MKFFTKLLSSLFFLGLGLSSWAQSQGPIDIAMRHLEDKAEAWGLNQADLSDLKVSNYHYGKKEKIHHFYFNQRYNNIDVYNAITSVHISDEGKAYSVGNRFVANLASKVNAEFPGMDQADAVKSVLGHLSIPSANYQFKAIEKSKNTAKFDKGKISHADIDVKLVYQKVDNGNYKLAWDVSIDPVNGSDYWSMRVDATDGSLLHKQSWTVHCKFDHSSKSSHNHDACVAESNPNKSTIQKQITAPSVENSAASGSYNVFAAVINGTVVAYESPIHGDRTMLVTPHSVEANPFGWHDTNGAVGAEYTITRGNNVYAYLDLVDDNSPEGSPDGGNSLTFDFPYSNDNEPELQQDAAVTNLFFMNNYMHDFSYAYGFDQDAGNFQRDNYDQNPSGAFDEVMAEAQDGGDLRDADHISNANFATPSDGANPRMQMYVWSRTGGKLLTVLSPAGASGSFQTGTADFGPTIAESPIIDAEVALAFDETQQASFCCDAVINGDEVSGKVAMLDRGGCFFETKVHNAEDVGALAVIICNYENGVGGMNGIDEADPTIPVVMVDKKDCDLIKGFLDDGVRISLELPAQSGPDFFDGDFDNGIIAHEYAHGISNRLTGGGFAAGCLGNAEQMGEGWSDFMALVTTTTSANSAGEKRGIGTWVNRENTNGTGIRSYAYSTDMAINPQTYADVPENSEIHALGAIWTAMIWDLYWAMVDVYGFDDDIISGTGGNNMAVQLVMSGMKLQPCSPGFIDGRDAILAADELLYDGAHLCLIWEVFARRGLGYYAEQGETDNAGDGTPDFNPLPICVKELKIAKSIVGEENSKDIVNAGDIVPMKLVVTNHKESATTNTIVTEEVPAGVTISDISNDGVMENGLITWNLGTMETLDEIELTYNLNTDPNSNSSSYWKDDLENDGSSWAPLSNPDPSNNLDNNLFELLPVTEFFADETAHSGENAWTVIDISSPSIENLLLFEEYTVIGENPVLRFFHNYDTQAGLDAGYIQVSIDQTETWMDITAAEIFKNSYPRPIDYSTFVLPFLSGYSGNSEGWIESWVDLSAYKGETINIRFRFATDDTVAGKAWFIDDVEYVNMVNYNGEACVSSDENDMACDMLPERGIKIEPVFSTATDDIADPSIDFKAFPNPASDFVNLNINNISANNTSLSIVNSSGQVVREEALNLHLGRQTVQVDVSTFPSGFYFLRLNTEKGVAVEKVMVH